MGNEYDEVMKAMIVTFATRLKENPDEVIVIESFIIEEGLKYFTETEQYELCQLLLNFTKDHPEKVILMTKKQFFEDDKWETI
jgi:hypothetical protein